MSELISKTDRKKKRKRGGGERERERERERADMLFQLFHTI